MLVGVGLMAWAPLSPYEFPLLDVSLYLALGLALEPDLLVI